LGLGRRRGDERPVGGRRQAGGKMVLIEQHAIAGVKLGGELRLSGDALIRAAQQGIDR
jgi:hypothetical protein